MRIVVDRLPDTPRECLFSKKIRVKGDTAYACCLRKYIEEADTLNDGYKPECLCKNVSNCDKLALEVL